MEAEVAKWQDAGILDMYASGHLENGRPFIELRVKGIRRGLSQLRLTPLHICRQSKLIFVAARGSILGQGALLFTLTPINGWIIDRIWPFELVNSMNTFWVATCFLLWEVPHLPD